MPPNVFSRIHHSEASIFKNEEALYPDYAPTELVSREAEIHSLASALSPAAQGGRPTNLFVHGRPGTGKTATCRFVLSQLQEYSSKPLTVYINCWQHDSRQSIFSLLADKLGDVLPRRGLSSEETFSRVLSDLTHRKRVPVIVLDEADRLFWGGEQNVLYDLTRTAENAGVHTGVILITNDDELMAKADERIRSSFAGREVAFKPYSPLQLKDILLARARLACIPGACNEEVIALCAAHGAKAGGDARVALQALWLAGKQAVARGASTISLDDARHAFTQHPNSATYKRERDEQFLEEPEKNVLSLMQSKGGTMLLSDLYDAYRRQFGSSERAVRNYLRRLEFKGILSTHDAPSGDPATAGKKIVKLASPT